MTRLIPSLSGQLVSPVVVERRLAELTHAAVHPGAAETMRRALQSLGPASSLRTLLDAGAGALTSFLGFSPHEDVQPLRDAVAATLRPAHSRAEATGLLVIGWCEPIEPRRRMAIVEARKRGAEWCLVYNGVRVGLVDARRVHVPRHLEIDLEMALDDEAGLKLLGLVISASSLLAGGKESALRSMIEQSDRLAVEVCQSLRLGVLAASRDVLSALVERPPRPPVDHAFDQALTIVYRLLFLLFAEARGLVPLWHPVYRTSYSVEALTRIAERHDAVPGLWDSLRASSRLAHAGCRLGTLRVAPFNGRLFAPSRTPLAERGDLDDRAARGAVLALATQPASGGGRRRIDYSALGVEQLGAVYESLLDYTPRISPTGRPPSRRVAVSLEPGSGVRKATGTFYTPQVLTRYLVTRALEPLVRDVPPHRILELRVLDPAMGSGAFLVAACEYLARAYETALIETGGCHASDLGRHERASIRRTIAERCLYGVDRNPVAVQLARLSLWLATLAADRPLSFLDHHLRIGDSLLGTWLTCLRRRPETRRAQPRDLPLFDEDAVDAALRDAVPQRFAMAMDPNDTLEHVRSKERLLASLDADASPIARWRRVADLWCSFWFTNTRPPAKAFGALADALLGRSTLPNQISGPMLDAAKDAGVRQRFFHWELEFPEVFFNAQGARLSSAGFDAIVGNPPWEMLRADDPLPEARDRVRDDTAAAVRFARDAGVYVASADGHANQYQLFVERAVTLTRPGGRIGLVLPAGIASDHGSRSIRQLLFSRCAVEELVGFENRRAIFPIHRSVRFVLLSARAGEPTRDIACRLGERDPGILEHEDARGVSRPVRVTPALLERLTGSDMAVPDFRAPVDVVIAERAATCFPALGSAEGWGARFGRELNATDDRHLFTEGGRGLPVLEGKHIDAFAVHPRDARWRITREWAARRLGSRHLRARLAYRDVASATNRMTLIAALLPRGCVSTHTLFCLRTALPLRDQYYLCGLFNSFVVNYLARLRVTTHVTTAIVERLPVPTAAQAGSSFREIGALSLGLSRRPDAAVRARLHALAGRLYRLSADEFGHVLATFPLVPREEREAAARAFSNCT